MEITTSASQIKWVRDFLFLDSNLYYTGFVINSSREGFGRMAYNKLGEGKEIKYEGIFRKNGPHMDSCKIYYENGKVMFEGKMVEGVREGFGRLYWENGKVVYSGDWRKNIPYSEEGCNIEMNDTNGKMVY